MELGKFKLDDRVMTTSLTVKIQGEDPNTRHLSTPANSYFWTTWRLRTLSVWATRYRQAWRSIFRKSLRSPKPPSDFCRLLESGLTR